MKKFFLISLLFASLSINGFDSLLDPGPARDLDSDQEQDSGDDWSSQATDEFGMDRSGDAKDGDQAADNLVNAENAQTVVQDAGEAVILTDDEDNLDEINRKQMIQKVSELEQRLQAITTLIEKLKNENEALKAITSAKIDAKELSESSNRLDQQVYAIRQDVNRLDEDFNKLKDEDNTCCVQFAKNWDRFWMWFCCCGFDDKKKSTYDLESPGCNV